MNPPHNVDNQVLDNDSGQLVCQKCGHGLLFDEWRRWSHGSWKEMEDDAQSVRFHRPHVCSGGIADARQAMKQYRATHPPMTFEEECRVYNEIMKNQTYILQ